MCNPDGATPESYSLATGPYPRHLRPVVSSQGISLLSQYEAAAIGAHWDNLNVDVGGGIDLLTVMVMLVFDCFLYTFLGWYLEQVLPKEFGVRQPFWFPFMHVTGVQ